MRDSSREVPDVSRTAAKAFHNDRVAGPLTRLLYRAKVLGLSSGSTRRRIGSALCIAAAAFMPGAYAQTAINAGGGAAAPFVADTGYSGGSAYSNTSAAIDTSGALNPAPQAVYHSERYGNFSYTIGKLTPSAAYRVRLHFVEAYWTQAGQRTFNVAINGAPVLSNFDIFAAAGARLKAVVKEFNVPASTAGTLQIQFSSVVNYAKVDGIEVAPALPVAIDAGGAAVGSFSADTGFTGGTAYSNTSATVDTSGTVNPAPQAVYHSERYGNFSYAASGLTPGASYRVRLHFVEAYWTQAGQRSFNVAINGSPALTNFDIIAAAGAPLKAVIKEFTVPASAAGTIGMQFTSVVNFAKVDGIELLPIVQTSGSTATLPAAPAGLAAVAGNAQATLNWGAVSGASSYNVKRATTSGGPYATAASGVTSTGYTNTGLTNGTTYYYVVSAVNAVGEGPNSAQTSVKPVAPVTIPAAPTNVSAQSGDASATLTWTASSGATSYNVKRASTSGGPYTTVATNVTATGYTNTGLTNGTTYYYVVSAVNSAGESTNSTQVAASPIAAMSPSANYMGINLGGVGDSMTERLYADLIRMSRNFSSAVDATGWPTSDFNVVVTGGLDQMNGTYALSFNGQATVSSNFGSIPLSYNATTNTSSGTFQIATTGTTGLSLTFSGTRRTSSSATGTGVTNIKLMRPIAPGSSQPHASTELFNRATKAEIAKFRAVRYVDFLSANSNVQTNWSDRPLPGWPSYNRNPGGAYGWEGIGGPWEHLARLANETNTDAWINIPVRATDAYIRNVALTLAYGSDGVNPYTSPQANPVFAPMNPNLRIYVEYSNELWNTAPAFKQSADNCAAASNELASTGGNTPLNYDKRWNGVTYPNSGWDTSMCWRRTAKRAAEISNIFRSVFGDAAMGSRVRPVLLGQGGFAIGGPLFSGMQMLFSYYNNGEGNYVANPHPPSYYFWGGGGGGYYWPSAGVSTLDQFFADPGMQAGVLAGNVRQDMALLNGMGLKKVIYEGGPSLDRTGGARDAIAPYAVNDPRMTTAIANIHNNANSNGVELFMYYTAAGDFQWGFTSNINNLATAKLAAIDSLNAAQRAPLSYGTLIPGTVAGSAAEICSRAWNCSPIQPATFTSSGSGNVIWASYSFRATGSAQRSVTLNFSSATTAQVAVYVDGVLLGTQSTSGGPLVFNAGTVGTGPHGVIVRAVSGSFTLSSITVQ